MSRHDRESHRFIAGGADEFRLRFPFSGSPKLERAIDGNSEAIEECGDACIIRRKWLD